MSYESSNWLVDSLILISGCLCVSSSYSSKQSQCFRVMVSSAMVVFHVGQPIITVGTSIKVDVNYKSHIPFVYRIMLFQFKSFLFASFSFAFYRFGRLSFLIINQLFLLCNKSSSLSGFYSPVLTTKMSLWQKWALLGQKGTVRAKRWHPDPEKINLMKGKGLANLNLLTPTLNPNLFTPNPYLVSVFLRLAVLFQLHLACRTHPGPSQNNVQTKTDAITSPPY